MCKDVEEYDTGMIPYVISGHHSSFKDDFSKLSFIIKTT